MENNEIDFEIIQKEIFYVMTALQSTLSKLTWFSISPKIGASSPINPDENFLAPGITLNTIKNLSNHLVEDVLKDEDLSMDVRINALRYTSKMISSIESNNNVSKFLSKDGKVSEINVQFVLKKLYYDGVQIQNNIYDHIIKVSPNSNNISPDNSDNHNNDNNNVDKKKKNLKVK